MKPTRISIGGVRFTITRVKRALDVCHTKSGRKLWGEISYSKSSIRIQKDSKARELRSVLHEIIHGIVSEYQVRELMDDKGDHLEFPIDQIALGLATALESLGIKQLGRRKGEK